ncbi:hypothetical protein N9W92_06130 [Planktomarina temperata]|nr:hypothetical protein [Planktomarina temperata]
MSLSLAGYLMNWGDRCIELFEDKTWIITADDEASLCFAAASVIDIFKSNQAHRVFVQGEIKNIEAIMLAANLSRLDLYVIGDMNASMISGPLLQSSITKLYPSDETKLNFLQSRSAARIDGEVIHEYQIFSSPKYPPESNWFYHFNFFSINPASAYSHNNYFLPNYVEDGTPIGVEQRAKALEICRFFKSEATSSWINFKNQIFICSSEK